MMRHHVFFLPFLALFAVHCGGGAAPNTPDSAQEGGPPGTGIVKELQQVVSKDGLKEHQEICKRSIHNGEGFSTVSVELAAMDAALMLPMAKDWTIQCDEETFGRRVLVDALSPSLQLRVTLPMRPMGKPGVSEKAEVEHWAAEAQESVRPPMEKLGIKITQSSVEALDTTPPGWMASAVYGEAIAGKVSTFPQTGYWGLFGEVKGLRVLVHVTSYDVDAQGVKARRKYGEAIVGAAHITYARNAKSR
jgi:hypothetical protein